MVLKTPSRPGALVKVVAATGATPSIRARFPGGTGRELEFWPPRPYTGCINDQNPRESPTIPKRKPPSQRPERQMDDTARAIARLVEEEKEKPSAESRKGEASATPKHRQAPPAVNGMGQRKIGGAAPYTSSKRPKTGGV